MLAWLVLKDRGESYSLCGTTPSSPPHTRPSIHPFSKPLFGTGCVPGPSEPSRGSSPQGPQTLAALAGGAGSTCGVMSALGGYVLEETPTLSGRVRGLPGGGLCTGLEEPGDEEREFLALETACPS